MHLHLELSVLSINAQSGILVAGDTRISVNIEQRTILALGPTSRPYQSIHGSLFHIVLVHRAVERNRAFGLCPVSQCDRNKGSGNSHHQRIH